MEENKTLEIVAPEGYEIDKENSTFEKIVFKKKQEINWRKKENPFSSEKLSGHYIDNNSSIIYCTDYHKKCNRNLFATEKQAKSALAMAQISQIMENDPRFGGAITDEEYNTDITVYYIGRRKNGIYTDYHCLDVYNDSFYEFLAFHTANQRDLFLKENEDLVREYLMLD